MAMTYFSSLKNNLPGFALVEVAIALTVLGIIGTLGLPIALHSLQRHKQQTTEAHAEKILSALSAFVIQEGRLPCPANPAAPYTSFGEEVDICIHNEEGILPFKTLGIPEALSKDGFGHYFTYVVESTLTCQELSKEKAAPSILSFNILQNRPFTKSPSSKTANFCNMQPPAVPLQVLNSKENSLTPVLSQEKDFIAVILVSHGEQGHGAFKGNQTLIRNQAAMHGPDEEQNANGDRIFIQRSFSLSKENYFDDLVFWVSRNTLLPLYAHRPCE